MKDTYADTWSGNYWVGFGQRETITENDNNGASKTVEFVTECDKKEVKNQDDTISGKVTVGGASYKDEIRWKLECDGRMIVDEDEGRAPYDNKVTIPKCKSCTLYMRDTYSDGWSGNYWVGFGQRETITDNDNGGKSKTVTFNSQCSNKTSLANSTTSLVTVDGGPYKDEIRWALSCDGKTIIGEAEGRAPFQKGITL